MAGREAAARILEAVDVLSQFPLAGKRLADDDERREVFVAHGAGAYVLRYRMDAESSVVVIRVYHSRQIRQ